MMLAMPADDAPLAGIPSGRAGTALEPAGAVQVPGPCPLTGPAPARTPRALAELMRDHGVPAAALEKTAAWLSGERRQSAATQAGYIRDVSWWLSYAAGRGLDLADVDPAEADLYAAALRAAGLADSTRARRLSAVSSWYAYLTRSRLAARNPFGEGMERPSVPQTSETRGLSEDELERMLAYTGARESARTHALLALMVATGCRVSSVTRTTLASMGRDRGHAVIDLPVKGGNTKRFVLPPFATDAVDRYLAERAGGDGPLFATRTGKPIDQPYVFRLVRRVAAAAAIADADKLSPHSLRHSVATMLLDRGHPLHVVQDFLGHADPRTTRRYDRARESLDRSPAYDLGAALAAGVARHARTYA
ncbi:MAG: integrase [Streptosporangiaceae bacterium]|jgi:integrase/recombinase XerD|nr:integrase [Streptosporangiaceae bacterium]